MSLSSSAGGWSPLQIAHLRLALVPQLGPKRTRILLEHFGDAEAVLAADAAALEPLPGIGPKLAREFAQHFPQTQINLQAELDRLERAQVQVVVRGEANYPTILETLPDAPWLLYYRGRWDAAADRFAVGMVGSRACTSYGKKQAQQIAAGLALAGRPVISGLARGIDAAAHRGALEVRGRTIAVLAGGLAKIYPPEHRDLAEEIVQQGGLLVTETPMTIDVQPGMFPARNRIISGLSQGVVVIEANLGSGALITIDHATEQGREIFVLPGPVDSNASAGCLELLRKGARPIRHAADLLEDLRGLAPALPATRPEPAGFGPATTPTTTTGAPAAPPPSMLTLAPEPPTGLSPAELELWQALDRPRHADDLTRQLACTAAQLMVHVMKLEMRKLLRRLPGNQLCRV